MRRKVLGGFVVLSVILLATTHCLARPVHVSDYDEMTAKSDLVVIATSVSTKELREVIDLPGVQHEGGVRIRAVGLETEFLVSVCFKGRLPEVEGKGSSTIVLHHYRFEDPKEADAGNRAELLSFKPGDHSQYLMFLKRTGEGRYEPFNGQTDPVYSVEKLKKPRKAD